MSHLSRLPLPSQGHNHGSTQQPPQPPDSFKGAANSTNKQPTELGNAHAISDGELVSDLEEGESMSLSEGEVYDQLEEPRSLEVAGVDMVGSTSLKSNSLDVVSIVKERIDLILKNRDPKLLQSPSLRALMLLLKCIRLDDPDTIYAQVKNASFPVVAELNSLSHEFGLGMITDACMNTLLVARSMDNTPPVAYKYSQDSDPHSADMDMRASSETSGSSRGVDMDTSSDIEFDDLPQPVDQSPEVGSMQAMPSDADAPLQLLSQDRPPITPMWFSRSRAPSPPSAQPKTPRATSQSGQSPNPQLFGIDKPPAQAQDDKLSSLYDIMQTVPGALESALCTSENGRLVVFLGSGDESSDSDGASDSSKDYDGDEEVSTLQQTNDRSSEDWSSSKARKRERRMLNGECRRLARDEQQLVARARSFSSLNRLGVNGYTSWSPVSQPANRVASPSPNHALHKAKMNLKAHEEAIAKLKLQISRKQAAASLRKQIHVSNAQKPPGSTSVAVSEPATPLAEADRDDTLEAPDAPLSLQTTHSEAYVPETLALPKASECKAWLQHIPAANRSSYSRDTISLLGDTIGLKQSILELIQGNRPVDNARRSEAESLLFRIAPRLDRNKKALEEQKERTSRLVCELQARLKLADMQIDILEHSRRASEVCRAELASYSPQSKLENNAPSVAEKKLRENALQEDIRAFQVLKDSFITELEPESEPKPGPEPAPTPATAHDHKLQSLSNDLKQHSNSNVPDNSTTVGPVTQIGAAVNINTSSKKRHVDALKTKMESMQNEQKGLSLKLDTLASKRGKSAETPSKSSAKGKDSADPGQAMPAAKRQKKTSANPPNPEAQSGKIKVSHLYSAAAACANKSKVIDNQQRIYAEVNTGILDKCILQPLIVADGIGMPALANPTLGILSKVELSSQDYSDTVLSVTLPEEETNLTASDYIPYESPFGSTDVSHNLENKVSGLEELGELSTAHLLEAMDLTPIAHPASIKQFHKEINASIHKFCKGKQPGSKINSRTVALVLLPIWKSYARTLQLGAVKKNNPLYSAIGLDSLAAPISDISSRVGYHFVAIMRNKDRKALAKTFKRHAGYLPILNRELAFYPNSSDKPSDANNAPTAAELASASTVAAAAALEGRSVRYFDIALDEDGSDSSGVDSDIDDELDEDSIGFGNARSDMNDYSDERICFKVLRYVWKGDENKRSGSFNVNSYIVLDANHNKRVGKAMVYLKKTLQEYPESERLWDLYLELYSRQHVADSEIVSAFSDATKFHPRSFIIWRRYIQWCGWNTLRSIGSKADSASWQGCLSMITAMAIKCLCGEEKSVRSEKVSATIAEMVVYFWDCSWATFESLSKLEAGNKDVPKPVVQFKSRLVAHMHACLTASSTKSLCDEISDLSASNTSISRGKMAGNSWKSTEWILGRMLLPHHLLFVGQVFICCFVEATFVPRAVLERMYASMYEGIRYQSTYYLCLDNAAKKCAYVDVDDGKGPQLQPYIVSVIRKMFGGIKDVLLWHGGTEFKSSAEQGSSLRRTIQQACGLCSASMRATLVQLKQSLLAPTADVESITECEDLLRIINKNSFKAPFDPKAGLLRVVAEQSFEAPLLMACLLCADDGEPNEVKLINAVCALREHSVLAAQSMGIDTTSFKLPIEDRIDHKTSSRENISLWISEARQLYYNMIGYVGAPQPKSERALALNFVSSQDDAASSTRPQFCKRAGTWTNLALIEVLHSVFELGSNLASRSAIDSAMVWLYHGQKQLSADNVGGCAQLWAMIMHFSMFSKPLQQSEIVKMHNDIGSTNDGHTLHITPVCHLPPNFVLRTVLDSVHSDDTISAIGNYVSYLSVDNAELAIR
ncbi:hypothetical protein EV178_001190 [Coemansia sp. RSA 1646]|nr:hypothetical protein EV178_001190 [Coemansia sp. RSA 1646]KAJ1772154.1 hypothetical protein LPJ74_001739 [Coemansia sp. RSA 1843]KAJ2216869.1 hypothetical protein EV179_000903 [Coemansia sp. RSA 487]